MLTQLLILQETSNAIPPNAVKAASTPLKSSLNDLLQLPQLHRQKETPRYKDLSSKVGFATIADVNYEIACFEAFAPSLWRIQVGAPICSCVPFGLLWTWEVAGSGKYLVL